MALMLAPAYNKMAEFNGFGLAGCLTAVRSWEGCVGA